MIFRDKIEKRFNNASFLCIGLDTVYEKIPEAMRKVAPSREEAVYLFNKHIVDATAEYAAAFKPNSAFYEAEGQEGLRALHRTVEYIHQAYSDIPVIYDAKRGDIESTNERYARAIFDDHSMDAVTLHPFLGKASLVPFLKRQEKGIFILARTSNAGSGEFQDLMVNGRPLYEVVAQHVAEEWNDNGNCGLVVGATYPEELGRIRTIVGEMLILVPGIGVQGGDLKKVVTMGRGKKSIALLISVSRSVQYASSGEDYEKAAQRAAEALNRAIKETL